MGLITDLHNIMLEAVTGRINYGRGIADLDRLLRNHGVTWTDQLGRETENKFNWMLRHSMSDQERADLGKFFARQNALWAKMSGKIQPDIRRIVRAGIKGSKTEKEIRNELASLEGRVRFYAATIEATSRAAFNNYASIREAKLAGVKKFRLMGPPAARSWCQAHLDKEYTLEEIEKMDNGQGLPVLYNCGGWRCRHAWVAVVDEAQVDKLIAEKRGAQVNPQLQLNFPKSVDPYELPTLPTCSKQEFIDSWSKYKPNELHWARQVLGKDMMTREQFIKIFTGDHLYTDETSAYFEFLYGGGLRFEYVNANVNIRRDFDIAKNIVDHAYFKIDDKFQGNSEYKPVYLMQLALYMKKGYKRVNIHPDIDVGCWAWGRYGFKIDRMTSGSLWKLSNKYGLDESVIASYFQKGKYYYDCVVEFCLDHNIDLLDYKDFIIDREADWFGYLDLTDKDQREQSIHYAKGRGWKKRGRP